MVLLEHPQIREGTWGAMKYRISPQNRTSSVQDGDSVSMDGINEFLAEFQWRRKNSNNLWNGFINAFKTAMDDTLLE